MNILLTNDDGIDAPGLVAAYNAVTSLGRVHVVAPGSERSACSHTITLRKPVIVERVQHPVFGPAFSVDGTPADCVRLAVAELLEDKPDLIVSGINRGANAGVDTFYSGTVAAAREGAILSIRSIALSQAVMAGVEIDWPAASCACTPLVAQLMIEPLPGPGFWNINLPVAIPEDRAPNTHRVPVAMNPTPMDFTRKESGDGRILTFEYGPGYWNRQVDGSSDFGVLLDGGIAVTAIPLYGQF